MGSESPQSMEGWAQDIRVASVCECTVNLLPSVTPSILSSFTLATSGKGVGNAVTAEFDLINTISTHLERLSFKLLHLDHASTFAISASQVLWYCGPKPTL